MFTSAMEGVSFSVDPYGLVDRESTDPGSGEGGDGVGYGWCGSRDADLADPGRWFVGVDQVDFDGRGGLDAHDGVAIEVLGDDVVAFAEDDLAPGRSAEP